MSAFPPPPPFITVAVMVVLGFIIGYGLVELMELSR